MPRTTKKQREQAKQEARTRRERHLMRVFDNQGLWAAMVEAGVEKLTQRQSFEQGILTWVSHVVDTELDRMRVCPDLPDLCEHPKELNKRDKIAAVADDERGDPNTRAIARRKLNEMQSE